MESRFRARFYSATRAVSGAANRKAEVRVEFKGLKNGSALIRTPATSEHNEKTEKAEDQSSPNVPSNYERFDGRDVGRVLLDGDINIAATEFNPHAFHFLAS
jgi:hypothetical protein